MSPPDAAHRAPVYSHSTQLNEQDLQQSADDGPKFSPAVAKALEEVNAAEDRVGLKLRQQLACQHIISYIDKSPHFDVPDHDDCLHRVYTWTNDQDDGKLWAWIAQYVPDLRGLFQRVEDLESARLQVQEENCRLKVTLGELENKCHELEAKILEHQDAEPRPVTDACQGSTASLSTITPLDSYNTLEFNRQGRDDDDMNISDEESLLSSFATETKTKTKPPPAAAEYAGRNTPSGNVSLLDMQPDCPFRHDDWYMEVISNPYDGYSLQSRDETPDQQKSNEELADAANAEPEEHSSRPNKHFEDTLMAVCEEWTQMMSEVKCTLEQQVAAKDVQFAQLVSVLEEMRDTMKKSLREAQISTFLAADKGQYELTREVQANMTKLLASRTYDEDGNLLTRQIAVRGTTQ